jgi:hypothetical protein
LTRRCDLSVSEGVESGLVAGDSVDEGFVDSEAKVGVFDIEIVYHRVGASLLVANPAQDAFRVCCKTRDLNLCAACDKLLDDGPSQREVDVVGDDARPRGLAPRPEPGVEYEPDIVRPGLAVGHLVSAGH